MSAAATAPAPQQTAPTSGPGTGAGMVHRPGTGVPATAPAGSARPRTETPRALRWWTFGTALACALFAVVSLLTLLNASNATSRAADDTSQLIRIQSIRANLLRADALATNAFLVGGLESAEHRASYDAAMSETSALIVEASAAQSNDQAALAALNRAVTTYASDMEQARANNRQGFPVGSAYLSDASTRLRSTALPLLDNLVESNQERAAGRLGSFDHGWLEATAIACLVVLGAALLWTARRFHRIINVGLAIAAALVLLAGIGGGAVQSNLRATAEQVRTEQLQVVSAIGAARAAANEAKVQESLRLISHGSGGPAEERWKVASADVAGQIAKLGGSDGTQLRTLWQAYALAHRDIVSLDDAGKWDEAVAKARSDKPGSANAAFAAFDAQALALLGTTGDAVAKRLRDESTQPYVLMFLFVPMVVGAGIAAAWGLRTRLREYL